MSKKLIAYFSASGTTANVANAMAKASGTDIHEIKPAVPYSSADLNWMNKKSRSSVEMNDPSFRPELVDENIDITQYDTVFIGFPVWWYVAPTIINSFLEAHDFAGKKIVLFATSGGSRFGKTVSNLKPSVATNTEIIEGKILNGRYSDAELKDFVDSF